MLDHKYQDIINLENLLTAWQGFLPGKRYKTDVIRFAANLGENILELHHLLYRALYNYFDERFVYDSYACRKNKGLHRALKRFKYFAGRVSNNNYQTCHILKCDIKKFFATVDQPQLMNILKRYIADADLLWLINQVVISFQSSRVGIGLPLGNLTSQLLVNIYMHEFDMFVKQELRVKYYIRYADDFVVLSNSKDYLVSLLPEFEKFLTDKLFLKLHENKVFIKAYASGLDFLGWVNFPHHRQLRTSTKRRVIRRMRYHPKAETVNSYRGLLGHGNTHRLRQKLGL